MADMVPPAIRLQGINILRKKKGLPPLTSLPGSAATPKPTPKPVAPKPVVPGSQPNPSFLQSVGSIPEALRKLLQPMRLPTLGDEQSTEAVRRRRVKQRRERRGAESTILAQV